MQKTQKNRSLYSNKLAVIFFCTSFVLIGAAALYGAMSTDIQSLLYIAKNALPGSFLVGLLGFFTGKMLDGPLGRSGKP